MNHIAAMEEQVVSERMRQKLNEVNMAAQAQLGPIQDHVNFTLQVCLFVVFDLRSPVSVCCLLFFSINAFIHDFLFFWIFIFIICDFFYLMAVDCFRDS